MALNLCLVNMISMTSFRIMFFSMYSSRMMSLFASQSAALVGTSGRSCRGSDTELSSLSGLGWSEELAFVGRLIDRDSGQGVG